MKSFNKYGGITKVTNKLVGRLEQFEKLKEIANRKNYPFKIRLLEDKLKNEYEFWQKKDNNLSSVQAKLVDLQKDLNFILSQKEIFNKERIDLLINKYGYGKSN